MSGNGPQRSLGQWLDYQQHAHSRGIDLELARVQQVAARLGLLTPRCPVVTVGGTNGKGSTATCLAALLQACGEHVGLFTSPHVLRYQERIRLDGVEADETALVQAFERIEAARGAVTLTFFEYNTLAALELFRAAQVSAMVLEVGLGGRLDATNILDADIAVLCSVGMDHRDWLGDTLEQIGREKAGIFRARHPVILGSDEMPASVWERARELGCELAVAGREFGWSVRAHDWDYRGPLCSLAQLAAPTLAGPVQYRNAACALTALQLLARRGRPERAAACDAARIGSALRMLHLPGRFQIVHGPVEWILDVAHNVPAAQVLREALIGRSAARRTLAVYGALADKDAAGIAHTLDALVDEWLLADVSDEQRGQTGAQLRARLPATLRGTVETAGPVAEACALARARAQPGDRVLVCGSFCVVGPALRWLGYTE